MRCLSIHVTVAVSLLLHVGQAHGQEAPQTNAGADQVEQVEKSEAVESELTGQASEPVSQGKARQLYEGIVLTFILLMFTNAIQCGQWAIQTKRNFWAWYLAGLFTGPLAGGTMLYRTGLDASSDANPGSCLGSLAGLVIPAAGWFIWLKILL